MHLYRVRTVMPDDILYRNPLGKIRLERVHPHIHQNLQLPLEPCTCIRVRKINDCHSRLPQICLPHSAVRTFQKIALLLSFREQIRLLSNIGINPHTDMQSFPVISLKHRLRIVSNLWIPCIIAPL